MTKKKLRILGIRGVPAQHGGFETFAEKLAPFLVARGWQVTVYCQEDGSGESVEDEWNGVRRIRIPVQAKGALGTVVFDWKSVLHASRTPELCMTLGYNTALFDALLRLRGVRNVFNMDGMEWMRAKWSRPARTWLRLNEWVACKLGDHLVADHPEIARHLERYVPAEKITMIPYGADAIDDADASVLEPLGLRQKEFFTVIARPEPENSILEIVEGFSMQQRGKLLVVLGQYDPKSPYCRAVQAAAGSEVRFLGPIYDKRIVQALRKHCLAYVHGHQVGGTNPSLVEALGAGNPVLVHGNRFNRWVAGPSSRVFFSAADCSREISWMVQNQSALAELGERSKKRFEEALTWPRVLEDYETLLSRFAS
jgi:glycosyltransferase involved in cell wall biosynthesis